MPFEGVNPPSEPAGYDPQNKYADPVLYYKHREAQVAQEYIKVAEAKVRRRDGTAGRLQPAASEAGGRASSGTGAQAGLPVPFAARAPLHPLPSPSVLQLIRKKLKKCYKESGVNYQQNCRELAQVWMQPPAGGRPTHCSAVQSVHAGCRVAAMLGLGTQHQGKKTLKAVSQPRARLLCNLLLRCYSNIHSRLTTSVRRCLVVCLQDYLAAIKGVGIYRANAGPHDEPRWQYYNAGKQ